MGVVVITRVFLPCYLHLVYHKCFDISTATRRPDYVAEVRMGNTSLTVSGCFKRDITDTSADKMAEVLEAESRCQQSPTSDSLAALLI